MDLVTAIKIVAQDVRASYPEMTTAAAIDHARDSVNPDTLDHTDPQNGDAWAVVLGASVMDLAIEIGREGTLTLTTWDFVGSGDDVTLDGMPALEWLDAMLQD